VFHFKEALNFQSLNGFPQGRPADPELLGKIAFGGQPFVFPLHFLLQAH